jgi:hypothetical protein
MSPIAPHHARSAPLGEALVRHLQNSASKDVDRINIRHCFFRRSNLFSSLSHVMPKFKERKLVTDPQKTFHFTDLQRLKPTRENDPYEYQAGWGNRHQSEVIPGTLPVAQNNPQEVRFGLYTEGITYSAFAAPRHSNFSTYMYRARPSAAHSKLSEVISPSSRLIV